MNAGSSMGPTLHHDAPLFKAALEFTAVETGFAQALIEKDYYCSVVLQYLMKQSNTGLVFKGGTCLAKVHIGFYRLSEDLDFVIPVPEGIDRDERSNRAAGAKAAIGSLEKSLLGLRVTKAWTGANASRQYVADVAYGSLTNGQNETIKIEVGLRESLLDPVETGQAKTLLLDPVSGKPVVTPFSIACISKREAYSEKLRAALSRREVAIRDFYDVDYAVERGELDLGDPELISMIKRKLAVDGNEPVDVSDSRLAGLKRQLNAQLEPVLKPDDFGRFDLGRATDRVKTVASAVA